MELNLSAFSSSHFFGFDRPHLHLYRRHRQGGMAVVDVALSPARDHLPVTVGSSPLSSSHVRHHLLTSGLTSVPNHHCEATAFFASETTVNGGGDTRARVPEADVEDVDPSLTASSLSPAASSMPTDDHNLPRLSAAAVMPSRMLAPDVLLRSPFFFSSSTHCSSPAPPPSAATCASVRAADMLLRRAFFFSLSTSSSPPPSPPRPLSMAAATPARECWRLISSSTAPSPHPRRPPHRCLRF